MHSALEKFRIRGYLKKENIPNFEVKDPKFAKFDLLGEIHKRLHDVPDRPVISNYDYYTDNVSVFLDFYLLPLSQAVKLYNKNTNDFLNNLCSRQKLPSGIILFTDVLWVVGL